MIIKRTLSIIYLALTCSSVIFAQPRGFDGPTSGKIAELEWLELKDDPGFTLNKKGNMKFFTFPHEEFAGPKRYTAF